MDNSNGSSRCYPPKNHEQDDRISAIGKWSMGLYRCTVARLARTVRILVNDFVAHKGYCGNPVRDMLWTRSIRFTISKRRNMSHCGPLTIYCLCNQLEHAINRFKHFRRIVTRYEKHAVNYLTMWLIAAIWLSLYFAFTP